MDPILALHGSASSGGMWRHLQQACLPDRLVLNPDLEGYGRHFDAHSAHQPDLQHRVSMLLDEVKPMPAFHLVAHSYGGAVALELIRYHSQNIKSITLYEPVLPAIFKGRNTDSDMMLLSDLIALSKIVSGTSERVAMESFMRFWGNPGDWAALTLESQNRLQRLAPVVYRDFQEAMGQPQGVYEHICEYQGPLTILMGGDGKPHAKRMAELLLESLPQGQIQVLHGMGHMGPATHAESVNRAILHHIREAERGESLCGSD